LVKLIFIIMFFNLCLFGDWHSRHNPPKPGQLFMVKMHEKEGYFDSTTLIIVRYDPRLHSPKTLPISGWYDVTKKELYHWMKLGYKIYIYPGKFQTDKQKPDEWDG